MMPKASFSDVSGQSVAKKFNFLRKLVRKSIPNFLKSLQNRSQIRAEIQKAFQTRPGREFFRFLAIFRSPRASQNRAKIAKIRKKRFKIEIKKKYVFQHLDLSIFRRFGFRKRSQDERFFDTVPKTSISWKSLIFLRKNHDLSGFEPPKIHAKSMPKRDRKKHRKKTSQNRFWRQFWLPKASKNPPQNLQNRSAKPRRAKLVSRRYANRAEVVGKQRDPAFVKRPYGYAYD